MPTATLCTWIAGSAGDSHPAQALTDGHVRLAGPHPSLPTGPLNMHAGPVEEVGTHGYARQSSAYLGQSLYEVVRVGSRRSGEHALHARVRRAVADGVRDGARKQDRLLRRV